MSGWHRPVREWTVPECDFCSGSIASVWLSVDDSGFPPKADTVTDGRHVSKVPISEVVASFDRFVLTSEQKGFFGNLFRIVPADPSRR